MPGELSRYAGSSKLNMSPAFSLMSVCFAVGIRVDRQGCKGEGSGKVKTWALGQNVREVENCTLSITECVRLQRSDDAWSFILSGRGNQACQLRTQTTTCVLRVL